MVMLFRLTLCAVILGLLAGAGQEVVADDFAYVERANRKEGLQGVPTGGVGITLLSFVGYREPLEVSDAPVLKLRFYLRKSGPAHITALELRRHGASHYQMKPLQESWNAGWQEFADWPTGAVLKPLEIPIGDLGIVARLGRDKVGSGDIAPIFLYATKHPPRAYRYTLHLLPAVTLSEIDYRIINTESDATLVENHIENAAANVPFPIAFDLNQQPDGRYRILIKAKEYGRTKGPSRQYFFHHRSNLMN